MQEVQLFVKDPTVISSSNFGIGLDMFSSSPIKITKSIQALEEPTATTSAYSQTFRVPNTSANAKFFKAAFNVNSVTFNAALKVPAYINVNGLYFMSGNVILNNIIYSPDVQKIEYELIFLGETSSFGSATSPKDLSALDLSDLAHSLNYNNIQLSWAGNLLNGNIVYPLAEYGYTYDDTTKQPNIPTLSVYNTTTGVKGFTNSANALNQTQFKPFVKARYILDKIFEGAGFTYTSTFLNSSPIFTKLYMISTNTSTSTSELALIPNLLTFISPWSGYLYTSGTPIKLFFPNETRDNANNWDLTTSVYTSVAPGGTGAAFNYTFKLDDINIYMSNPAKSGAPPNVYFREFQLQARYTLGTTGVTYTSSLPAYAFTASSFPASNVLRTVYSNMNTYDTEFTFNLVLPHNSKVEFFANLNTSEVSAGATISSMMLGATGPAIVDPTGIMPTQVKQIDFIKGVNDRFKLMWEPDPENPKNFLIEPWVDWIKGGTARDWTDKLDRNSDVVLTPLFQTQPREIIFKDSEESDLYNFSYQQQNKETFGQLNQDSGLEVITGSREIKSMFAPFPLGPIGNSNKFLVPHFAKDTETERQPIQIKPRLAFYNGTGPAPNTWYMKNDVGAAVAQTVYPIASSFSSYPFDSSVFDLNWTNVNQFWDVANYPAAGAGRTPTSAYTSYWEKWFNFTYSPYGRVMEATFALDIDDFRSIRFNDKIFVRDSWWLPIEIKDYSLNEVKQKVKVKLVKLGDDVGVSFAGESAGLYSHPGIIFASTPCAACCTTEVFQRVITVYSNTKVFSSSTILFLDPGGTIQASPGSYSNGTDALNVLTNGSVDSITTCSSCTCVGSLTAISVTSAASLCSAYCSTSYIQTVYGDGAVLANCKSIYANSFGTIPLTPYYWYKNASALCQVGADGSTIVAFSNGAGCNCVEIPPSE